MAPWNGPNDGIRRADIIVPNLMSLYAPPARRTVSVVRGVVNDRLAEVQRCYDYTTSRLFEEVVDAVVGVGGQPAVGLRKRSDEDVVAVVEDSGGRRRLTASVRDTHAVHVRPCRRRRRSRRLRPLSSSRLYYQQHRSVISSFLAL